MLNKSQLPQFNREQLVFITSTILNKYESIQDLYNTTMEQLHVLLLNYSLSDEENEEIEFLEDREYFIMVEGEADESGCGGIYGYVKEIISKQPQRSDEKYDTTYYLPEKPCMSGWGVGSTLLSIFMLCVALGGLTGALEATLGGTIWSLILAIPYFMYLAKKRKWQQECDIIKTNHSSESKKTQFEEDLEYWLENAKNDLKQLNDLKDSSSKERQHILEEIVNLCALAGIPRCDQRALSHIHEYLANNRVDTITDALALYDRLVEEPERRDKMFSGVNLENQQRIDDLKAEAEREQRENDMQRTLEDIEFWTKINALKK